MSPFTARFFSLLSIFLLLPMFALPTRSGAAAKPAPRQAAPATEDSLARFLPADEMVFIELTSLKPVFDLLDALAASEDFRRAFATLPNNPIKDISGYSGLLTLAGFPDKALLARCRLALGVRFAPPTVPPRTKGKAGRPSAATEPQPEFSVLIEGPTAADAEQLRSAFARLLGTGTRKMKPVRLGTVTISSFPSQGPPEKLGDAPAVAQHDRMLVVGQLSAVRATVGLFDGKIPSLAQNTDFTGVRRQLGTPNHLLAFINTKTIGALIDAGVKTMLPAPTPTKKRGAAAKPADPFNNVLNNITTYLGFTATSGMGFGFGTESGRLMERVFIGVDSKAAGLMPALADAPHLTYRAAAYIPDTAQSYIAMGFNGVRLYDETIGFLKSLSAARGKPGSTTFTPDQLPAFIEGLAGFKLRDDLLANLTGEYGLAFSIGDFGKLMDPNLKDLPADTRMLGYAVTKNPDAIKAVLGKLRALAKKDVELQAEAEKRPTLNKPDTENYQGVEIQFIADAGFALLDEVLVVGRPADVRWAIDARTAGKVLARHPEFVKTMGDMPKDAIFTTYASEDMTRVLLDAMKKNLPAESAPTLDAWPVRTIVSHLRRDANGIHAEYDATPYLSSSAIVSAITGIGIPAFLMGIRGDNDAAAQITLRNIHAAQKAFQEDQGAGNFTDKLDALVLDEATIAARTVAKSGYLLGPLKVTPKSGNAPAKFSVTMVPAVRTGPNRTGNDCYYIDETGVLRHSGSPEKDADASSEPVPDSTPPSN